MPRKAKPTVELWEEGSTKELLAFKWNAMKRDPRIVVLSVVELMLAVCIAVSIALYLDPDWNVVPFPWNIATFIVLLGVMLLIHRRTRPYRIAKRLKKAKK